MINLRSLNNKPSRPLMISPPLSLLSRSPLHYIKKAAPLQGRLLLRSLLFNQDYSFRTIRRYLGLCIMFLKISFRKRTVPLLSFRLSRSELLPVCISLPPSPYGCSQNPIQHRLCFHHNRYSLLQLL
jgi:hypothetical protein